MRSEPNVEKSTSLVQLALTEENSEKAIDYLRDAVSCTNDPKVYLEYLQALNKYKNPSLQSAVYQFALDCLSLKEENYIEAAYEAADLLDDDKEATKGIISMICAKQNPSVANFKRAISLLPKEIKQEYQKIAACRLATNEPKDLVGAIQLLQGLDSDSQIKCLEIIAKINQQPKPLFTYYKNIADQNTGNTRQNFLKIALKLQFCPQILAELENESTPQALTDIYEDCCQIHTREFTEYQVQRASELKPIPTEVFKVKLTDIANFSSQNPQLQTKIEKLIQKNTSIVILAELSTLGVSAERFKGTLHLDLRKQSLEDVDIQALAEVLKDNTTITSVCLRFNNIGDEGAIALAEVLKVNTTITEIDLRFNNIEDEGAIALAEVLKVNTTITEIDLTGSNIGDKGAIALAEVFKVNTTITSVYLSGNNIGADGARALAEVLEVNTTISCQPIL